MATKTASAAPLNALPGLADAALRHAPKALIDGVDRAANLALTAARAEHQARVEFCDALTKARPEQAVEAWLEASRVYVQGAYERSAEHARAWLKNAQDVTESVRAAATSAL